MAGFVVRRGWPIYTLSRSFCGPATIASLQEVHQPDSHRDLPASTVPGTVKCMPVLLPSLAFLSDHCWDCKLKICLVTTYVG